MALTIDYDAVAERLRDMANNPYLSTDQANMCLREIELIGHK